MLHFDILLVFVFGTLLQLGLGLSSTQNIDRKHVKCLVCYRVVEELFNEIGHLVLLKKHQTGSKLNVMNVKIQQSEIYFDDLMDRLCKKMGEYVRVFNKSSGQLEVIPLLINGKMNLDLGSYNIIKDGDIESLEFYCQSIISEHEEEMLKLFKEGVDSEKYTQDLCLNPEIGLCKPLGSRPIISLSKDEF